MGASWFVRPETCRLLLSEGHWLLVKKRLNTGEKRQYLQRSSRVDADGTPSFDSLEGGRSLVLSYLLDWSLTDDEGGRVAIGDTVIDNLDPDRFREIKEAIETHEAAMQAERTAEKNGPAGEMNVSPISPSPSEPAGVLSGSVN